MQSSGHVVGPGGGAVVPLQVFAWERRPGARGEDDEEEEEAGKGREGRSVKARAREKKKKRERKRSEGGATNEKNTGEVEQKLREAKQPV